MAGFDGHTDILVLGGGFAGAYCARRLEKRLHRRGKRITLVSRQNYFTFTPLLMEAGTGALEPRHAVVPLRRFLKHAAFEMAEVDAVNFDRHEVNVTRFDGRPGRLRYEHLVLSIGSVTRLPDVTGLAKFGVTVKSMADAVALRDRAIGMLELANTMDEGDERNATLTFVIVGGGYAGVEVAGELMEFLTEATRLYPNIDAEDIRIVLVDNGKRIIKALDEDLANYARKQLLKRGIQVRLGHSVTQIERNAAHFEDGDKIGVRTVIWTAGIAPESLINELDLPKDDHGYLNSEADLRVKDHDHVWGIGDCAANPDPDGNIYPATAQHAIHEGLHCADNIARVYDGRPTRPLKYKSKGMIAPLGNHRGVARVGPFNVSGLPAWVLWRTYYLIRMPGFERSLRVMLDWTLDWFFHRDYVQMGLHDNTSWDRSTHD